MSMDENDNIVIGVCLLSLIASIGFGLIFHSAGVGLVSFVACFIVLALLCSVEA